MSDNPQRLILIADVEKADEAAQLLATGDTMEISGVQVVKATEPTRLQKFIICGTDVMGRKFYGAVWMQDYAEDKE